MKTPVSTIWIPGMALVIAWLPGSFAQTEADPPAQGATSLATPSLSKPHPAFPAIATQKDFPVMPSASDAVTKRQPPRFRLSPWTSEIVKLAESGISEDIMLTFIENAGTFNLGADQIVYLNDLGLSSEIITAMLRHDQEIVSGVKPLTVTSDPAWDLPFELNPVPPRSPSQPTPTLAPAQTPRPEDSRDVSGENPTASLAAIPSVNADEVGPIQTAAFLRPRKATDERGNYRVRKPHPEEVTSPIILIYGESRPPNTVVVVGFPRTTP